MALGTLLPVVGASVVALIVYAVLFIGRREKGLPPGTYQSIPFNSHYLLKQDQD